MILGKMLNSIDDTKAMAIDLDITIRMNISVQIWSTNRNRNQRPLIQVVVLNAITII